MKRILLSFTSLILMVSCGLPAFATVDNETNFKRSNGDAVTTVFTFNFKVLTHDDLDVYLVDDTTHTRTIQTEDTDYTLSVNSDGGGTVTFAAAPAADEDVFLIGAPTTTQTADFPRGGKMDEQAIEAALDRAVLIDAAQNEILNRSIKLDLTDPLNTSSFGGLYIEVDDDRSGKVLQWNDDGDEIVAGIDASDITDIAQSVSDASDSADAAASSASAASSSASAAAASATNASGYATTASGYATAASASASAAATSASVFTITGTSTSTVSVGTGSKSFTLAAGGQYWVAGERLRVATGDGAKVMEGNITSFAGTALTIDVTYTEGSGSSSAWNITKAGARGASGAGSGDVVAANYGTEYSAGYGTLRSNIGLAIGTNVQAYDADLAALAGLTSAADKCINFSGSGTASVFTCTSFGRTFAGYADAATAFAAIKQDASESATGVVELATVGEVTTGTDTTRAVTPAGVAAAIAAAPSTGAWTLVSTQTASASATINFTSLSSSCIQYKYVLSQVRPATDNVNLWIRTSSDGGSSYDAGATHYEYGGWENAATTSLTAYGSTGASAIILGNVGIGNGGSGSETFSGEVVLINPADTTSFVKAIQANYSYLGVSSDSHYGAISGMRSSNSAVNAIRFMMSSGNIASGSIAEYCLSAS